MANKRTWDKTTTKTRMISVRLPLEEYDQLKDYCDGNGLSITDFVRIALQCYLIDENWNAGKEDGGIISI